MGSKVDANEIWRRYALGDDPGLRRFRRLLRVLPASPRCKLCNAPFRGVGGPVMRLVGKGPSTLNPHFCSMCENYTKKHRGGAELEFTMLFADIRGSTPLAESLGTTAFSQLIARFFRTATDILIAEDAMINRLIGDEAVAFFLPGWVSRGHSQGAIRAARRLLEATGHTDPSGPWAPVGVGINTGNAFIGVVGGAGNVVDITALGDEVNTTARLASLAGAGEIVITEATRAAADLSIDGMESRHLQVKGRAEPVDTWSIRVGAPTAASPSR